MLFLVKMGIFPFIFLLHVPESTALVQQYIELCAFLSTLIATMFYLFALLRNSNRKEYLSGL